MDIAQVMRIMAVLLLIACLDLIVYLIALKFNSYYRSKIPMSQILKKELEKGLEPLGPENEKDARVGVSYQIKSSHKKTAWSRAQGTEEKVKSEKPAPARALGTKILDTPETAGKPLKSDCSGKFRVEDKVELYGSKGEMTGVIISCNDKNSKSEPRYLVDWGKDGIWWVAEDQIETCGFKKIELSV